MEEFDRFAEIYDLDMGSKVDDLSIYFHYAQLNQKTTILELGCGTGRIIIPLASAGFEVYGLDSSRSMLEVMRQKIAGLPAEIVEKIHMAHGDMRKFNIDRKFELIIIGFNTFLHLLTHKERKVTLQNLRKHLTDDGLLVIDIFTPRHHELAQYDFRRDDLPIYRGVHHDEITGISYVRHDRIKLELAEQTQNTEVIYDAVLPNGGIDRIVNNLKTYYMFRSEMELLLELTGYELVDLLGGYDVEQKYDYHNSEVMVFVARKS